MTGTGVAELRGSVIRINSQNTLLVMCREKEGEKTRIGILGRGGGPGTVYKDMSCQNRRLKIRFCYLISHPI